MIYCKPLASTITRNDGRGDGKFGARRDGGSRFHTGRDFVCIPGEAVFSMIQGKVVKYERPYTKHPEWSGVQIENHIFRLEMWYMDPRNTVAVGQYVNAGEMVGVAQDISLKYPPNKDGAMTPHIHVRLTLLPFNAIANDRYISYEQHVDPAILLIGV